MVWKYINKAIIQRSYKDGENKKFIDFFLGIKYFYTFCKNSPFEKDLGFYDSKIGGSFRNLYADISHRSR